MCWILGHLGVNYTTKFGRDLVIDRIHGMTRVAEKWQGCLLGNYKFYQSQVWDPACSHKKPHSCGLFGTRPLRSMNEGNVLQRHPSLSNLLKFRDCIQAWRTWWWATFIMHDLCRVWNKNYDSFHCKLVLFGKRIPKKFAKKMKIWHLLHSITLWIIWIERNDWVFNQDQMA